MATEVTSFTLCESSKNSPSLVGYSKYKCEKLYLVLTYLCYNNLFSEITI